MGRSRTENILINMGFGVLTRISNLIVRFLLQTILIHTLGIQYIGISSLFTSILTVLSLAELGIGSAVSYALYKPLAEQDREKIASIMCFYRSAYRLIALAVLALGLLLLPFLGEIVRGAPDIRENLALIYIMYLLKTTVSYLLIYKSTLLVANQQNYLVSAVQALMNFLRTGAECAALLLTGSFMIYLALEIAANILQNLWISKLADRRCPQTNRYGAERLSREEKKEFLLNIKGIAMYKASHSLGNGVDSIVISAFSGAEAVGLMSNYILIKDQLTQLLNQFYNALIPSVGNLAATAQADQQHSVFSELMFLDFWVSCFSSVSFFVLVQPFILLWLGESYLLSAAVAGVISLDFYLACMMNPVASFRNANGLFVKGQYRPLIMTVMNVILSFALGKRLGIFGVLAATVFSRLVTQWYDPWLLYRHVFRRAPGKFFRKYYTCLAVTLCCAAVTAAAAALLETDSAVANLLIRAFLCLLLPNLIIAALYHKNPDYRKCAERLKRMLRRKARR